MKAQFPRGRFLVTGAAGFIGSNLVDALLAAGSVVTGLDSFDPYYGAELKRRNLGPASRNPSFRLVEGDCRNRLMLTRLFAELGPLDAVVHLAARAGVRPSLDDAELYFDLNVRGTQVLLDALTAHAPSTPFVHASSSSVYGNSPGPFREDQSIGWPLSPYAASKQASELVAHVAHHLHGTPVTVLRFFTAYGPRQRPDMAIAKFAAALARGETIPLFGDGSSRRDYTYVADIVDGILRAMRPTTGYRVFNLGSGRLTRLSDLVEQLAHTLAVPLHSRHEPEQLGEVPLTWADVSHAETELGFSARTDLELGLAHYAAWLRAPEGRELSTVG